MNRSSLFGAQHTPVTHPLCELNVHFTTAPSVIELLLTTLFNIKEFTTINVMNKTK